MANFQTVKCEQMYEIQTVVMKHFPCCVTDGAAGPRLPDHGSVCPSRPGQEGPARRRPERSAPGLRHEDAVQQGAAQQGTEADTRVPKHER